MTEQQAIEQLIQYRQKQARLQVLSTYPVGMGITVSRINEDDQLQDLHRRLRGLPSYMYLSKHEQELEQTAYAYMTRYPAGTRSQLAAVPWRGADKEDDELLKELRDKIRKVIAARGWDIRDDIDAVLERVAEYQDLKAELLRIDNVLHALELYKPDYAKLLRLRFVNGLEVGDVARELNIVRKTFDRWRPKAIAAYIRLVS